MIKKTLFILFMMYEYQDNIIVKYILLLTKLNFYLLFMSYHSIKKCLIDNINLIY